MVIDWRSFLISSVCLIYLATPLLPGATLADTRLGTGAFPNAQAIETELIRGKSTRADVQKLLGIPNGAGGAMLPGFGDNSEVVEPYDVWYYEDIESGDFKSEESVLMMDLRQQILVIFFKGDKFHGYFWTSNENVAEYR